MPYRNVMNRRTLLRGAGTVAVALPFLDAMRTTSVYAAPPEPPVRAFNLFFGLGYPMAIQDDGFAGPIEPLQELSEKLLMVRGVDQVRAEGEGNAHFDGAGAAFNATEPVGESQSGGATIDQVLRRELYPMGQPSGVISTLLAGTWFRRSRPGRYLHSWNEDGTPAGLPEERPEELFVRIFGEDPQMMPGDGIDEVTARRQRYQRSILDSLVGQYQHYQSDASNLGKASRARIAEHLDKVREHEMRVFGEGVKNCEIPPEPTPSQLPHEAEADPDGEGIDITVAELTSEWRLMAELYATAIECDLVRFGGLTFQAAGERIRLSGDYSYGGEVVHSFDDLGIRGVGGAAGCSHEYWHDYTPGGANTQLRAHLFLMMAELAYFLKLLDTPETTEENGLTILQNSLISISTESGDGRHQDPVRELTGVFHMFTSANERLRTGAIVDVGAEGLDVYNTIIQDAYGLDYKMGPAGRAVNQVTAVLP